MNYNDLFYLANYLNNSVLVAKYGDVVCTQSLKAYFKTNIEAFNQAWKLLGVPTTEMELFKPIYNMLIKDQLITLEFFPWTEEEVFTLNQSVRALWINYCMQDSEFMVNGAWV